MFQLSVFTLQEGSAACAPFPALSGASPPCWPWDLLGTPVPLSLWKVTPARSHPSAPGAVHTIQRAETPYKDFFSKSKPAPPPAPKRDVLSDSSFFQSAAFKLPSLLPEVQVKHPAQQPQPAQPRDIPVALSLWKWLHPTFLLTKIRCQSHFVSLYPPQGCRRL